MIFFSYAATSVALWLGFDVNPAVASLQVNFPLGKQNLLYLVQLTFPPSFSRSATPTLIPLPPATASSSGMTGPPRTGQTRT